MGSNAQKVSIGPNNALAPNSFYNWFEERVLVHRCTIFKWVPGTWPHDKVPGQQSKYWPPGWHALLWSLLFCLSLWLSFIPVVFKGPLFTVNRSLTCPLRTATKRNKSLITTRSRKVSKSWDWVSKWSWRFDIWQVYRQQCCRGACQISE